MTQLQHERQKVPKKHDGHKENQHEKEDRSHTVVTRIAGTNNTISTSQQISSLTSMSAPSKKQISSITHKTSTSDDDEEDHRTGTQMARGATMASMKKSSVSAGFLAGVPNDDITSISSGTMHSDDNEKQHGHQPHVVRMLQTETKMPSDRQISNKTSQNSNPDSLIASKVIRHDSSKTSSHIFQSSTINLISKSEIFDQDFHLDDPSHAGRKVDKRHGKVNISGREK